MRQYFTTSRGQLFFYLSIIAGLLIIAMVLYYFGTKHHGTVIMNKHSEISGQRDILITNQTALTHHILFEDGRNETLSPGATSLARLPLGSTIRTNARYYGGGNMQFTAKLNNPVIRELHITSDGFKSEINISRNVLLQNDSDKPVIFVHKSTRGDRRWPSCVVAPNTGIIQPYVAINSRWEVVNSGNENYPLDTMTIGGKIGCLRYDGRKLSTSKKLRFDL